MENPPVFTRYLYIKNDVVWSLFHSIIWREIDESLFWAYELYYSGFQEEVFTIIQYIYDECYKDSNPVSLQKHLQKIYEEWKETPNKDWLLATYVVNILYRKHDMMSFIKKYDYAAYSREPEGGESLPEPNINKNPKKIVFIQYREEDIKPYKTLLPSNKMKAANILKEVCKYTPRNDGAECCACLSNTLMGKYMKLHYSREEVAEILKTKTSWLYYAHDTPIWAQRIQSHKGICNHDSKTVQFNSDIMKLAFLNKYGYVV